MSASIRETVSRFRVRVVCLFMGLAVLSGLLTNLPANAESSGDIVVVSPTAVAAGWRVVVKDNFEDWSLGTAPANGGITFTKNSESAVRVFGPGVGFGSVEVTFGPTMVGKTVSLAPWDATVSAPIAGAGVSGTIASTGKAVFALPTTSFGLLYFTGVDAASITITGVVAKTAGLGGTTTTTTGTTAATTTITGATTTVAPSGGDVAVATTTSVAPGWRVVVDANFNGIAPANGGITFAPNSETAFRVFGPGSTFRSVEVSFGPSMVGKTVGLAPWDATVSAAITGAGTSSTVDATGKAIFALPTTPFGMLYFTGINAASVTITGITVKAAAVTGPTTTVVGGQTDLAVATTTSVAAGWRVVVDANFNGVAPANGGVTFAPNTENAFRVFGPGSGYRSVEVTFGPSMVGKTVGLAPWDATVSAAISGAGVSGTVDATGKVVFALPTTPFGMLYFTGVNAASVTITGITVKGTATGGPTTTIVGGQADVAVSTTTAVAGGWRVVVDANFNGVAPTNGGITFAPNTENAFRVFGPGTGFRSVEVTFGPSMVGKTVGLAPWDATVSAAISGAGVSGTVDASGKVVLALPTTAFGMLYFTGINAASVTITGITAKAAVVSGPPTTTPGTQTDLGVVTPTAVLAGWRVVADSNFNGLTPANGGITFAPNTENAFRLFGSGNGFGSVEVAFGPSMVGKTVGLAPWDATVSAAISGAGVTGVVASTGKAVFALPTTPFGMLYFTGVSAASITITGITLKTASVPGGTGTGGPLVSPNPCPNRTGTLRVWPIGDSLTVGGYGTGNYDGPTPFRDSYRYELFRLLGVNGYSNVQFRGDLGRAGGWGGNLPAGVSDEFSHSGYGGRDIPFMLDQVTTLAAVGPVDPDLIILNIGHNGGTPDQLTALVARLQQLAPYAVIVIGGLAQSRPELTGAVSAERAALRAKAQALGAISTTDRVLFANVFAGMQQQTMVTGDYADDTHYNVTGGTKFANALLPAVLTGLSIVSGARCTPHASLVDGGTPVDPGTPLATDLNVVQTGPVAYATGFTSTPTLTTPTAPLALTIDGPAKPGARAVRVDMNSTGPVKVQVATQDGTRTFADFTVAPGNTTHSIPFTTPLGASPIRITLTAAATYTLRTVTLVGRPFITVTTNPTYVAGVTVPVTISGVWDPGVTNRTFLRVQAATDANSCTNCGATATVTAAGQTFFNTLTPGLYKAVLYTNTPGEVIGISPDFEVLPEVAVPSGKQIVVYDDKLSDAFRNWSWATHNLDNTTPALGTRSISFEADNWKGLTFHADQISTAARTLSIQINGGTAGGQQIVVGVTSNQQTISSRQLTLTPGWQSVTLTFPAPVAAGSPIEVSISAQSGNDQPTVYLDDIKLGTATPPPTTTGTLPPTTTPATTRPPTTLSATTTRPATTAVATTRPATTTTRPATTIAGTTTRPATTTIAATTTRPPTTLAATTTRPPTTVATTTTIALTTTVAPTTVAPQPPYPGLDQLLYGSAAATSACYTGDTVTKTGLTIPAEAWNRGVIRAAGTGYIELIATPTYNLNGVTGSASKTGYTYTPGFGAPFELPAVPVGSLVISYQTVLLRFCISDPSSALQAFINLPSTNGVIVTTTPGPPTTGTPTSIVGVTTTPPPVTTLPPDGRPAPFTSPANYFKTKYSDTSTPGQGACLSRRSTDQKAGLASCADATRRGVVFEKDGFGNYKLHPTGDSSTCLRISRNASNENDGQNNRFALTAEWGACATSLQGTNFLDDTFNMILRGDGWYWAKPANNYAGWNQPCLSAHATNGSNNIDSTTGNIYTDANPVIQYECQPNIAWQQWAPAERDWAPGPPTCEQTNTCPPPPTDAHLFVEDVPTLMERVSDLACLVVQPNQSIRIVDRATAPVCNSFIPKQTAGGYRLLTDGDPSKCLAPQSLAVVVRTCGDDTVWDDSPFEGVKFGLYLVDRGTRQRTTLCLGGTTTAELVQCNGAPEQSWYDSDLNFKVVLASMPLTLPTLKNETEIQLANDLDQGFINVDAMYTSGSIRFVTLVDQSPFQQVIIELYRRLGALCRDNRGRCRNLALQIFNQVHAWVADDLSLRVGSGKAGRECTLSTRQRIDVVRTTCATITDAAEVKTDWPPTIIQGTFQLQRYLQQVERDRGFRPLTASPAIGWPVGPFAISPPGLRSLPPVVGNLITYQYYQGGVYGYRANNWQALTAVLVVALLETGAEWVVKAAAPDVVIAIEALRPGTIKEAVQAGMDLGVSSWVAVSSAALALGQKFATDIRNYPWVPPFALPAPARNYRPVGLSFQVGLG